MKSFPVVFRIWDSIEGSVHGDRQRVLIGEKTLPCTSSSIIHSTDIDNRSMREVQIRRLYVADDLDGKVTVGDEFVLDGKTYEIIEVNNFPQTWFERPSWFGSSVDGRLDLEVL